MPVNKRSPVAYGFSDPLITEALLPIVSVRVPTGNDFAPIGTFWIDSETNTAYVLTSIVANQANWEIMTQQNQQFVEAQVQTPDNAPTALATIPIPINSSITISGILTASDAAFANNFGVQYNAAFYRAGGAANINPAPAFSLFVDTTNGGVDFDVLLVGNNAVLTVTGQAATVWNWKTVYYTVTLP